MLRVGGVAQIGLVDGYNLILVALLCKYVLQINNHIFQNQDGSTNMINC